jgi:hypothetical protein
MYKYKYKYIPRVVAATYKSSSVMVSALEAMHPKPTPGKMYALFPCPGENFCPLARVTGSKGEPEANTHLPMMMMMLS